MELLPPHLHKTLSRDRSVPPLRTGQGADAGGSRARHEAIS